MLATKSNFSFYLVCLVIYAKTLDAKQITSAGHIYHFATFGLYALHLTNSVHSWEGGWTQYFSAKLTALITGWSSWQAVNKKEK